MFYPVPLDGSNSLLALMRPYIRSRRRRNRGRSLVFKTGGQEQKSSHARVFTHVATKQYNFIKSSKQVAHSFLPLCCSLAGHCQASAEWIINVANVTGGNLRGNDNWVMTTPVSHQQTVWKKWLQLFHICIHRFWSESSTMFCCMLLSKF